MPDHDVPGSGPPGADVVVGTVSAFPETAGTAAGRGAGEITFGDGRRARVDAADPRASGCVAVLETLRSAGLPAYVELAPGTDRVREVLVPVAVHVGELRDEGEASEVELIVSQARHLPAGVLGRRRRAGQPDALHLLDYGAQPHDQHRHLRGPLRGPVLTHGKGALSCVSR